MSGWPAASKDECCATAPKERIRPRPASAPHRRAPCPSRDARDCHGAHVEPVGMLPSGVDAVRGREHQAATPPWESPRLDPPSASMRPGHARAVNQRRLSSRTAASGQRAPAGTARENTGRIALPGRGRWYPRRRSRMPTRLASARGGSPRIRGRKSRDPQAVGRQGFGQRSQCSTHSDDSRCPHGGVKQLVDRASVAHTMCRAKIRSCERKP
jgi:hypothetical protein